MPLVQNFDASKSHEESDLNDYEMKIFEKLQTLIPPSIANNYKTVCEIFDEFLETQNESVLNEEACSNTQSFLTGWILESEQCPRQVLDLVRHVFQIVIDKGANDNDSLELLTSWLISATLISLSQIPNLILDGTWKDILYELLEYTRLWDIDSESDMSFYIESQTNCWEWMIETACSPVLCPCPYLRFEIFRLIHLFDPNKIVNIYKLDVMRYKSLRTAYIECMSSINPEQLFVIMGNNLLSMRNLMRRNRSLSLPWILKYLISDKVVEDLRLNQIGKEVRFVANSLKVIGMFAQIAKTRYKGKSKYLRRCLHLCMYLFMLFHNNFSENVYNHELLLPYTCYALADITDGILALSASINTTDPIKTIQKRMSLYNKIVKRRNDLVNDIEIPKEKFFHVKLCQREQASHKFSNILFMKKAALTLTKLELGTICSDEIKPMTHYPNEQFYYRNEGDDNSHSDSDDSIERRDVGSSTRSFSPISYHTVSPPYSPTGSFSSLSPLRSLSPVPLIDDHNVDSDLGLPLTQICLPNRNQTNF